MKAVNEKLKKKDHLFCNRHSQKSICNSLTLNKFTAVFTMYLVIISKNYLAGLKVLCTPHHFCPILGPYGRDG